MIHPQCLLSPVSFLKPEVSRMGVSAGAWLIGSLFRMILAVPIVVVLVLFLWKLGKLADAWTEKLRSK